MKRDELFSYAREHFKSEPEYLWSKFPGYAVLRHHDGNKWFGIVMNVSGTKLGLNTDDELDILEVKARPEHIGSLRKKDGILPAYHMNKEHWVSVLLSGSLSPNEIYELLADSHDLTSCKNRSKRR
ncbi:MmcQ/YjbR family DNA-binding protein [Yersinia nurmii]|uniref:MmcQ/YjbR family DNA-binding protein n=1 Tax=Yersinia nurmii TaxID=685706 RepID=A0AAW7K0C8_9GAMM|nr:MmcQ/YjbR family DNA-binding protein [Yersinia nurmii]MDN0088777.1 MmcQ/YjbR family DNA-binding protein [Yersinia nurmii]CNE97042.1 protein yjbR [Yersinia nurmii]